MNSLAERGTAKGQKNMEGVNMPASPKFAWRWIVGTTAAAMLFLAALPSVGHADTLTICISGNGRIKGVNVDCGGLTSLTWETVGPQGDTGPDGVTGPPGLQGPQGAAGPGGITGPNGAQGANGPTGDSGVAGGAGATGPQGPQGNPGIQGPVGPTGPQGPNGVNGTNGGDETNKTFLTGGSLGDLGFDEDIALSGLNSVTANILVLGPGNGADTTNNVQVPMNDPGAAFRLFVNVDNAAGVTVIPTSIGPAGTPISYVFFLCNGGFGGTCQVTCAIIDPDTTCSDTVNNNGYAQGDLMGLFAFADDFTANSANVKWSVTYQHNTLLSTP